MASEIDEFIAKAKSKGLNDKQIREKLKHSGWSEYDIDVALDDLVAPAPPKKTSQELSNDQAAPVPNRPAEPISVVQNLSVRGFEYAIMFISLLISAFAIGTLAHKAVYDAFEKVSENYSYGGTDTISAFMVTVLIVCFPIFAFMFLRLKKVEIADPSLRNDPSRRKWSQGTQLIAFLVGIGYLVGFLYTLISPDSTSSSSIQVFLNMAITVTIAGGIFAYFWQEDHKNHQ